MQTTCGFGHIYDSNQYASCPYCNRGTRAVYFGAGGSDKTVKPEHYRGNPVDYQRTVAPEGQDNQRNDDIGKTDMPDYLKERIKNEEQNKTIGFFKQKHGLDPVVGWLVCIEGPEKGKDYRLLSRINTIGRAEGNDVVIASEQTISQKNHARLAYDEKHNNFQMIPGEGHNITYLNDMPLYVPQMLHAYDVIEFGETKLLFIPLCTERFQWKQEDKG